MHMFSIRVQIGVLRLFRWIIVGVELMLTTVKKTVEDDSVHNLSLDPVSFDDDFSLSRRLEEMDHS